MTTTTSTQAGSPSQTATTLKQLLAVGAATYGEVRSHLEGLEKAERIRQCCALVSSELGRLYEVSSDGAMLTPDHMVRGVSDGETVRWQGKNSLPLFTSFQKHFLKRDGLVVGLNHGSTAVVTGPGYFTCRIDPAKPREMLIDYTKVPAAAPAGWPSVRPNEAGLSRFVYKDMYDYCRHVTDDVVIGAATRLGKSIGQFFVLART